MIKEFIWSLHNQNFILLPDFHLLINKYHTSKKPIYLFEISKCQLYIYRLVFFLDEFYHLDIYIYIYIYTPHYLSGFNTNYIIFLSVEIFEEFFFKKQKLAKESSIGFTQLKLTINTWQKALHTWPILFQSITNDAQEKTKIFLKKTKACHSIKRVVHLQKE